MWFLLVLILGIAALSIWMWKRPDPVKRDQAKAVHHDLWIEQVDAQLKHALRLISDPIQPNYERGFDILNQLAQQQDIPQAYMHMGLMHLNGWGRPQSTESAIGLLDNAFRLGSDEAAYHLGRIYETDDYAHQDVEKALYWYRHAVARGNVEAQLKISELAAQDEHSIAEQKHVLLQKNADQGHANSQFQLSQYYLKDSDQQDLSLGVHYLFLAAQQDHLAANQQIAHYYSHGQILEYDPVQALQFIKRSVALGDQQSLYAYYAGVLNGRIDIDQRQRVLQHLQQQSQEHKDASAKTLLGLAYFHGWYVKKNETMAYRYWDEAAKLKHPDAMCMIAALYFEPYIVEGEAEKAFELYQQALQIHPQHLHAQMGLALCYMSGIGTAKDTYQATRLIQSAVKQHWQLNASSEADLIYSVGRFYSLPEYPLPARAKAVHYLNQAVSKGSNNAAWYLYQALSGMLLIFEENETLAKRYLHEAAQLGHAQAQAKLGHMYLMGEGVEQDLALGLKYLQQSAAHMNSSALNTLGEAYENGFGVEPDIQQSIRYYVQAAAKVNPDAYSHLGRLYTKGIGVERDVNIAREWLEKGSLLGHEGSQTLLKNVNAYLEMNE